jgi:hypothetical protein
VQQSDTGVAVGVVFDLSDFGRDIVFIAAKIDDPVEFFMSSTPMTTGNYTSVIASLMAMFGCD